MMFWVGTTDTRWFEFLSRRPLDEVNFWQPSTRPAFDNAPIGMPFVFKVKRPYNHIAGAGYFITRSVLPLNLAWEIFGEKNGAASLAELRDLLGPLAARDTPLSQITCQVIANPVFFAESDWLADPPGWSSNIVRGKMYRTDEADGAAIWAHVLPRLARGLEDQRKAADAPAFAVNEPIARYGEPVLMRPRLGQGSFRVVVTEAYQRKCAMTGERFKARGLASKSADVTRGLDRAYPDQRQAEPPTALAFVYTVRHNEVRVSEPSARSPLWKPRRSASANSARDWPNTSHLTGRWPSRVTVRR